MNALPKVSAQFEQEKKFRRKGGRRFRKFRIIALSIVLFAFGGFALIIGLALSDIPPMDVIENPRTDLSSQIYTADGVLIRNLYSEEHRVSVKLSEISHHVLDALIAAEDIRFFTHSGVDSKALFAIAKDKMQGGETRGGSTITMQLARNLYDDIGRERSLWRKLKEMVVAVILEKKFTKEEIITAYLNTVSFVGNTYGIQNGARHFFNKDAINLNVQESALLVGVLKGTTEYNPRKHPEAALNRRNTVLNQMIRYGMMTEAEGDSVKALPIDLAEPEDIRDFGIASYFTEHLRDGWLKHWCDSTGYNMYTDGLKIYTTLDSRMQAHAEAAVREHFLDLQPIFDKHITGKEPWRKDSTLLLREMGRTHRFQIYKRDGKSPEEIYEAFQEPVEMKIFSWERGSIDTVMSPWDSLKYFSRFLETGFMAIDPTNGHIKAWVGGIDHRFFKYDHVYTGKRQVGSTFKPFVYAAAFDNGMEPCTVELNQPIFFYDEKGKMIWNPKNADGKTGGFMTLKDGLANSVNLITARVMKRIGPEMVCDWAHKIGIQSDLDCVPSLALGTTDLSVYEMAGAYCTFANKGVWNQPIFVTRIEDRNGHILAEFKGQSREALPEVTAYKMIEMLQGVVNGGTAIRLRYKYKVIAPIGGKTGTTQNHSDGWFMGVTPNLVAGCWVGCSIREMRFRGITYGQGASLALPIYAHFMKRVYADSTIGLPKDPFEKPAEYEGPFDCKEELEEFKGLYDEEMFDIDLNSGDIPEFGEDGIITGKVKDTSKGRKKPQKPGSDPGRDPGIRSGSDDD